MLVWLSSASFSYLTSSIPSKSNLHTTRTLATPVSDPDLYMLHTFQIPNLKQHDA